MEIQMSHVTGILERVFLRGCEVLGGFRIEDDVFQYPCISWGEGGTQLCVILSPLGEVEAATWWDVDSPSHPTPPPPPTLDRDCSLGLDAKKTFMVWRKGMPSA